MENTEAPPVMPAAPAAEQPIDTPPTTALWDAGVRLGAAVTLPPLPLAPVAAGMRCSGPLRRVQHTEGVVSIFTGIDAAAPGDVLLIDNSGRTDEACVGDLVAIEALQAGIAGIVVWGCHRDSDELAAIGLPVFSLGPCPASPRLGPGRTPAPALPPFTGRDGDGVTADSDGVLIVPAAARAEVAAVAERIVRAERAQAEQALKGVSLREQLGWDRFLERRRTDPGYAFRSHLAQVDGALE
ncbi:RraA family protein [Streptomyces hiroshimensis]|uniref:Putative 4-hydroxy-4-methyl-2-oxoglutarate aldolase n=1 Tax=Streptomyces hiroshimensis TaxID=66424 RepID=A0ABQ2Y5H2_9ACTN|nr:RraA family protein [Streptomyces hiroshimensis]GGX65074.1 demethylmenaquinone methyltransferase [Streptomyces hiroshimensis]